MKRKEMKNRSAEVIEKERRAVELRLSGYSYPEIAAELGISVSNAFNRVQSALTTTIAKTAEDAEKVRNMELHRLDALLRPLYAQAKAGDPKATEMCLKIMDRRAKYLGLDSPEKLKLESDGISITCGIPPVNEDDTD